MDTYTVVTLIDEPETMSYDFWHIEADSPEDAAVRTLEELGVHDRHEVIAVFAGEHDNYAAAWQDMQGNVTQTAPKWCMWLPMRREMTR